MSDPDGTAGGASEQVPELMETALELAREAGQATLRHFGEVVESEAKGDGSPVTAADREAESFLRAEIGKRFPDHGILGEEFGEKERTGGIRWILDPIDGTRSFMRGVPLYAVLIGIEVDGEPAVGVAHFPALRETVWAGRGQGCHWQPAGTRMAVQASVSGTRSLSRAVALTTDPGMTLRSAHGRGWSALASAVDYTRTWGDAYGHMLVATGRAEFMLDPEHLSPWDAAPLLPIMEEAGGRFTDLSGARTIHGGSGFSSNGHLHEEALALLNSGGRPH